MCRLFGLSAAPQRITATFWLVDAPDSLAAQSHREPDGVGLGYFRPDGTTVLHKRPVAAYQDTEFAEEARHVSSTTFLAHVRYATTGGLRVANTHPFEQDGRLFAHNGAVGDLDRIRDRIGAPAAELVHGDTDSELVFALITIAVRAHGDVGRAITEAVSWLADNVPVLALNLIVTTATDLWALRFPDTHPLYVLTRAAGGSPGNRPLDHRGRPGTIHARSGDLVNVPATIVASEPLDDELAWRLLAPGELLHVANGQHPTTRIILDRPPRHPMPPADVDTAQVHPRARHP